MKKHMIHLRQWSLKSCSFQALLDERIEGFRVNCRRLEQRRSHLCNGISVQAWCCFYSRISMTESRHEMPTVGHSKTVCSVFHR